MSYLLENETFKIRKCLWKVHDELGSGFLEKVYQEALEMEFHSSNIPFSREHPIHIYYQGVQMKQEYIADFICYDKLILELKAVSELTDVHRAQVYNYLKATNLDVALLVNFGETPLKIERLFNYRKNRNLPLSNDYSL